MILKAHLKLSNFEDLNTNMGSLFHGFLMQNLGDEMTTRLHGYRYNPLRQRLRGDVLEIVSLEEGLSRTLEEILNSINEIHLTHRNKTFTVLEKAIEYVDINNLISESMNEENPKRIYKINFYSPTSFKDGSNHEIFPNIRKIIRSIMLNFDYFIDNTKIYDYETLEHLTENIQIIDYNLRSTKFELESVKIPAFRGGIVVRINGNLQILKLINIILKFGVLSGTGVKTSMGMGGIDI